MLGMLFLHGRLSPSELDGMTYSDMRYWYGWLKAQKKSEKAAMERAKKGKR